MSDRVTLVFRDEMGYARWPAAVPDWTGQVNFLDACIAGRAKMIKFYEQLDSIYQNVERLLVVQDNWSIHAHKYVLNILKKWPRLEPVWLPTYSLWLNPIGELWRWLRQDVLKLHRLAGAWPSRRGRVNQFLDPFAPGSQDLLRYVGLKGKGKLAQALQVPP